jgi:membrane carboxypeptidase/penicillin-binding protein
VAAPIWQRFMTRALAKRPVVDFPKPDTVVSVAIDPLTGKLATADTANARNEFFISGTEPTATPAPSSDPGVPPVPAPEGEPAPVPNPS